ncbi:YdeI family protein [Devosia sp.]|jgi:uncharacterized protein YdeI (YjbR/CyaY-like superfamily)|uniref:YdeI family protein n=1 Tax=Devosia sp. TaxID=1871048 RepID=UPI0037BE79A2
MAADHPEIEVKSRAELRAWLEHNHALTHSIWLITWKKHTPHHLPYAEVVDEALCFGWIDSQPKLLDADRSMIRLSPRKPGSGWSRVNKDKIERLIAAGLMAAPGLAKVDAAKLDGSWTRLDAAHADTLPDDLVAALAGVPGAAENFNAFPPSTRRATLEWISLAKRPETRAARVEETARLAGQNLRANQWKKP